MANELPQRCLSDVADLRGGCAFRSRDYTDHGRFVLRTKNIREDGSIIHDGATFISEELAKEYSRFELEPVDTLFVMVGATLGKVGFVTDCDLPALLNQNMWLIRAKDKQETHPRYLNYWFRCKVKETLRWATGSARGFVRRDDYRNLEFPSISYREQCAIVRFLGSLEDKIELNRRTNKLLEQTVRAIFGAWFIDFEPVQAKAAGAAEFPGMPQGIFDRLPRTFVSSEFGRIPAGWDVIPIGELVQVVGGGTPSTKDAEFWDGGVHPFCTPKDMSRLRSPVLLHTERRITDAGVNRISSGQLPVGTVLLSSRAPIGYLAVAYTPVSVNQGIIAMRTGEIPTSYILMWTQASMEVIRSRAGGSTFDEISRRNFRPISVLRPDNETLRAYGAVADPAVDLIAANEQETEVLENIRDRLLPKLISGEISVPVSKDRGDGQ